MSDLVTALVDASSALTGVSAAEILGRGRHIAPVAARHAVWLVLREQDWGLVQIGQAFGRDQATVWSGTQKAARQSRSNPDTRVLVEQLRRVARASSGGGIEARVEISLHAMDQEIAVAQSLLDEIAGKLARLRAVRQQVAQQRSEFGAPVAMVRQRRTIVA